MHPLVSSWESCLHVSWRRRLEGLGTATVLSLGLLAVAGCGDDDAKPQVPAPSYTRVDTAALDVMPGVYPNAIDASNAGELEVALLGGEALDATSIDASEATLTAPEGTAKVRALGQDTARDVDGDGRLDAVFRFSLPALRQAGVLTPESTRVLFDAKTRSGATVSAQDGVHDASHTVVRLPEPTGPHAVGTLEVAWTDSRREETFTSDADDQRALKVRLWYPATPRPQAQPAPYFLHPREGELLASGQKLPPQVFGFFSAHSVRDAALAEGTERFPVLLFSHGYGTATALYSGVAEELASHGYVVAAVSHTFTSSAVVFPDGRVAEHTVELSPSDAAQNTAVQNVWTADVRFVLDALETLDASDPRGRFTGRLDLSRVGMFGHSFGGSTAGEVCRTDARVKAGLNMDGTFFGNLAEEVHTPFLVMNSEEAAMDTSRDAFFEKLRATGYDATFRGGGHYTFSDLVLALPLLKTYAPEKTAEDFELGTIEGARSLSLVKAYVRAFFDKHLRERPAPLLEGPSAEHPEVALAVHNP